MKGLAVVLVLLSHGNSRAADGTEAALTVPAAGVDDEGIEEIIVFGQKKKQIPELGKDFSSDPVINLPSRFHWQFLPAYDLK